MAGTTRSSLPLLLTLTLLSTGAACPKERPGGGEEPPPPGEARASTLGESSLARLGAAAGAPVVAAPERKLRASSFTIAELPPDDALPPPEPEAAGGELPLSLTASDGTGLALRALKARAVIEAPLAFTELFLTFENPEDRLLEGRFQITLPPGATISRFAMKIDERWQEGEVVERQAARRAYEDFLHRRQDPALLEQEAGNSFSARVFPIPPRAKKELILSYSHTLAGRDAPYLLPLQGLPELGLLDVKVMVSRKAEASADQDKSLSPVKVTRETLTLRKEGWTPTEDFRVETPDVPGRLGLRHGNLVALQLMPVVGEQPDEIDSLCVLVDTSASRALGFHPQIAQLRRLVASLAEGRGAEAPVLVAAFDQSVVKIFQGGAGAFGRDEVAALRERRALGASDLQSALVWLSAALEAMPAGQRCKRALLMTDGVATAGEAEGDTLRQAAAALGKAGVERLDALVLGGIRDEHTLRELVTAGLPRDGVVIDGDDPFAEIGRRLTEATASGLSVKVEGAKWVWPETLDGVQSGDEVLVFADLPAADEVVVSLEGARLATDRLRLDGTERPLLERAWVQARIARLEHQRDTVASNDDDLREGLKKQMTELSVKHRVLSPYTAFLVLETEADYERFGIDRKALSDILTVGERGITLLHRGPESLVPKPPPIPVVDKSEPEKKGMKMKARNGNGEHEEDGEAAAEGLEDLAKEDAGPATGGEPEAADELAEGNAQGVAPGSPPAPPPPPAEAAPAPAVAATAAPEPEAEAPERDERRMRLAPRRREAMAEERPAIGGGGRGEPRKIVELPWTGEYLEVKKLLEAGQKEEAMEKARGWREESPGDVLALVALGEALEQAGNLADAARAFGSIIDLFPSRADLRRYAGNRLEALAGGAGLKLAADSYAKAAESRPDHPASHRLLAFALLRLGRHAEAYQALAAGLDRDYPSGRFAAAKQILGEDLALVARAWAAAAPERADEILEKLKARGLDPENAPSLRFVLTWETDANDVDFHIYDAQGGHAYYSQMQLPSGGNLYADVTTGYGPECFTIRGKQRTKPYTLQAHYYSRGPMGYGMGLLQVIDHDGSGKISVDPRPYVVMKDGAYLDLGVIR
ncbi:MAG: VIT domain-containing protein [Deltaproteobacteria bacterium]|nr:VIT domain-containing protein [Deltaproteobacteria bacterium]